MSLNNSQSDFSSKISIKLNNSEYSYNKKSKKGNQLIEIRKLYPKFSDDDGYEENNDAINKRTLAIKKELLFKRKQTSSNLDEEENNTILSEDFLHNLIKRPCPLNKNRIISVMSKFIKNSSLIQKIQKEFQSDKKLDINELSIMCVEILNYIDLKKGDVLFRIGDIGDRFYFILSGKICILKLKEIKNIQMDYYEYIDYCMFLIKQKETYIFNEVIRKNDNILRITSEAEVKAINKIFIMRKIKQCIIEQLIPNIKSLKTYLDKFGSKLEDFDIQIEELMQIENNKLLKNKQREWNNYLFKKFKPNFNDLNLFEPFEEKIKNKKKHPITCFCYEPFLFLGPGLFFGDFALDSEMNKRNATIRAEEYTILGFLKSVDYINIFAPKRKLEKLKEIAFLYNNYFFGNINSRIFEKNYFHLFYPREYIRNTVLFKFGTSPKSLILLKEGKVSLELKSSIIDLHNLIKFLWENIQLSRFFKVLNNNQKKELIPIHIESKIKGYINEPIFINLKVYGDQIIQEMNKIKTYQVSMLTSNEIIGLEEIFLNIPYIMKGTVIDNKLNCYEISVEQLKQFLSIEKQIVFPFIKSAINKIISLIERLQNFKKNGINMAKSNYEKDYNYLIKSYENENIVKKDDNFIKINIKDSEKESVSKSYIKKGSNMNNEKNKTTIKNHSNRNKYKNINNSNNLEKRTIKDYIGNKRYKSPLRIISTNLMPILPFILSRQEKINKKESPTKDNKINFYSMQPSPEKGKESLFSEDNFNILNQNELESNYNIEEIINNDNINKDNNNISNSTSTDIIPSSENNIKYQNIILDNNKTINELIKELSKINVIEFENKEIINLNKGYENNKKSFSYNDFLSDNNSTKIKNYKKHSLLKNQLKLGNFHLSYVPLNILSPKGRLLQRSHSSVLKNIDTNSLSISKPHSNKKVFNYFNLYPKKMNKKDLEEEKEKNNEKEKKINYIWYGIKTKELKNINNININNELSK